MRTPARDPSSKAGMIIVKIGGFQIKGRPMRLSSSLSGRMCGLWLSGSVDSWV